MTRPASINALEADFFVELANTGLVSLTGQESATFLQGQLTIDMTTLPESRARRAAHCDFKGKTWSLPLVFRHADGVALSLNRSSLAMTLAQLNKYGVFSKTDIIDASETFCQFFVAGEKVSSWINTKFAGLPDAPLGCISNPLGSVIRSDVAENTFQLVLNEEGTAHLREWLNRESVVSYDEAVYEALCIKAGIPDVRNDHINEFVPQMMNVQALDAIDFGKGCYMGQEVVARTKYLGKNKRAAFIFRVPEALQLSDDALLEKELAGNWRRGGAIIRSATLSEETWLMAVLNNDTSEEDVFRVKGKALPTFSCEPLPYSIEQETNNVRGRS